MTVDKGRHLTQCGRTYWVCLALCAFVATSSFRQCEAQPWYPSPDGRSVQHIRCDGGDWRPDAALRASTLCGPDKVFSYGHHGPSFNSGGLPQLNTQGTRFGIASICYSGQLGAQGVSPAKQLAFNSPDAALQLCLRTGKPVVGFRHEVINQVDIDGSIMFSDNNGGDLVPLSQTRVIAYVPLKDGGVNLVEVKHPERLFPGVRFFDGWVDEADDIAKFTHTGVPIRGPRSELRRITSLGVRGLLPSGFSAGPGVIAGLTVEIAKDGIKGEVLNQAAYPLAYVQARRMGKIQVAARIAHTAASWGVDVTKSDFTSHNQGWGNMLADPLGWAFGRNHSAQSYLDYQDPGRIQRIIKAAEQDILGYP